MRSNGSPKKRMRALRDNLAAIGVTHITIIVPEKDRDVWRLDAAIAVSRLMVEIARSPEVTTEQTVLADKNCRATPSVKEFDAFLKAEDGKAPFTKEEIAVADELTPLFWDLMHARKEYNTMDDAVSDAVAIRIMANYVAYTRLVAALFDRLCYMRASHDEPA